MVPRRTMVVVGLLVALVCVAYAPVLRAGRFVWHEAETRRALISGKTYWDGTPAWENRPRAAEEIVWPPTSPAAGVLFAIEYRAWGDWVVGYRLVSVALHVASAMLLWKLLRRAGLSPEAAALGAGVWAVHPVNVETVAWIAQQGAVLGTCLGLCAAHAWLSWTGAGKRAALLAVGVLGFLAMLASPLLLVLPVGLLLLTWVVGGRLNRRAWAIVPLVLVAGWCVVWLGMAQMWLGAMPGLPREAGIDGVMRMGQAVGFYAGRLAMPIGGALVYPRFGAASAMTGLMMAAWAAAVAILFALRRRIGRGPVALVLWFLAALLPVIGLINRADQQWSPVADQSVYLASVALGGIVAALAARMGRRAAVVAGIACLLLAVLTVRRAALFADPEALYRQTLARNPGAAIIAEKLADELVQRHGPMAQTEALALYQSTLAHAPWRTSAARASARIYADRKDPKNAQDMLQKTLAAIPENRDDPETNEMLADMVVKSIGALAYPSVLVNYERAFAAAPENAAAAHTLAEIYYTQRRLDEARAVLEKALRYHVKDSVLQLQLANILALQHDYAAADPHFDIGTALDPKNAEALCTWALMCLDWGKPEQAERLLRRAIDLDEKNPKYAMHLGRALREEGQLGAALRAFLVSSRLDDQYAPACFEIANTYLQLKDEEHAEAFYWQALRQDPKYLAAQVALARLLMTDSDPLRRNPQQALLLLREAVYNSHEQDLSLLAAYGDALARQKQDREALLIFNKALALGEKTALDGGQMELLRVYQQALEVRLLPPLPDSSSWFSLIGTGREMVYEKPLPPPPQKPIRELMTERLDLWHDSKRVLDPRETLRLPDNFVMDTMPPFSFPDSTGLTP